MTREPEVQASPAPGPAPRIVSPTRVAPGAMLRRRGLGGGNAALARLARAPDQEPKDVEPTADKTGTVNSLPQLNDTAGALDDEDRTERIAGFAAVLMKPKATKASPLVTHSSARPDWVDLAETRPAGTPVEGFTSVAKSDQPVPVLKIADSLYIGGSAKAADVHQGMVGDCWDLAVVAAIAGSDPGKIAATIAAEGNGVKATFIERTTTVAWGFPPKLKHVYTPTQITTSGELPFTVDVGGRRTATVNGVRVIHGAKLHHGAQAVEKHWWLEIEGDEVKIRSQATYEVARWAPLLEKAFAIFAAQHGQYGGTGADGEQSGGKGYDSIVGGWPKDLYGVFYGEQGDRSAHPENVPAVETTFNPGTNVLAENAGIIRQLLPLQGRSDEADPRATGPVPLVTATTSSDQMIKRLGVAIDFMVSFEEYEKSVPEATRSQVTKLRHEIQELDDMYFRQDRPDAVKAHKKLIGAAAGSALTDDLYAARADVRMGTAVRNVADLALDAVNPGVDSGTGRRNLYGEHAYTVVSCAFAGSDGKPVVLPPTLPTEKSELLHALAAVGQEQSTVRVRNPHHGNEPDEKGDGKPANPASGKNDDGLFTMNLTQFMTNVAEVSSFTAPHS